MNQQETQLNSDFTPANFPATAAAAATKWETMLGLCNPPTGSVTMYAGATVPTGWLACDGSLVSTTTYPGLYAAIGTAFGSGSGTFGLPDMRGVFPKGAVTTNRSAGKDASGNYYAGTLGTYSEDKMQGHLPSGGITGTAVTAGGVSVAATTYSATSVSLGTHVGSLALGPDATNGTPRIGHTTEPQSLGLNFIIKF